uniref:Uncharacterized protein n=1 Tax=Babesia rodhaini TaxID=5870 RepID=A0A455R2K4_BABRO|nr:hypothetical protein [Babesia rodhaini]
MKKIKIYLKGKKNKKIKTIFYKNNKLLLLKLGLIISYKKIYFINKYNIQKLIKIGSTLSYSVLNNIINNLIK